MTSLLCRKHGHSARFIAFRVGGVFDTLPSWFNDLVSAGRAKVLDFGVSVRTITGNWRQVQEGGYIVFEEPNPNDQWGNVHGNIWEMSASDFSNNFNVIGVRQR